MPNHWYWKKRKHKTTPPAIFIASMISTGVTSTGHVDTRPVVEDKGLAIEPIVGIRTFNISNDEGYGLHSMNGAFWPPRQALAAFCCNNPFADHEVPFLDCTCGIYAWKPEVYTNTDTDILWGEVYLWGDVIVCERGYRAEFAYPKALHINAVPTRAAQRIREGLEDAYGVPVTLSYPTESVDEDVTATNPLYVTSSFTAAWYPQGSGPTGPTNPFATSG